MLIYTVGLRLGCLLHAGGRCAQPSDDYRVFAWPPDATRPLVRIHGDQSRDSGNITFFGCSFKFDSFSPHPLGKRASFSPVLVSVFFPTPTNYIRERSLSSTRPPAQK
ncbi:hypothetical protein B0T11DRAFT_120554 [Plectosphaerella cucumerina]|uniref:Secreted protein n=1 Tax=Plectosphaerella cucumerina TaxID=40658 RepID=A0A8K0T814_9PEZI|nr:hypothetical protein B0T11DRAFT_120554 [Plectosphaerella cucumerina]